MQQNTTQQDNSQQNTTQENVNGDIPVENEPTDTLHEETGSNSANSADEQLLQSASVDINGDGINEQIEVVESISGMSDSDSYQSITGFIKIKDGDYERKIPFWDKRSGSTELLSGLQFEDLDGDGTKDIFIIIHDSGAAFSFSKYFIYSYKKDLSYALTSDRTLAEFIGDFSFKNAGERRLTIKNSRYDFSVNMVIELDVGQDEEEDYMNDYERQAWIDPVSIDISENSRIALIRDDKGRTQIKVPLPIFGLATINMIGEIDLYYSIDDTFKPVLRRFEVIDFDGSDRTKVGSYALD